jgi:uncharacterized membrane protein
MTVGTERQAYLDRVRGLAVLIMIEAHVLDSWTREADRSHRLFGYGIILGGLGAPLFLFLAGVAVYLSAASKFRRTGDSAAAWRQVRNRGWQVFGLAFLFRFQSYVLSGGASLVSLLKVDILNIMGPSIAFAAIAGAAVTGTLARAAVFSGAAFTISMLTPVIRAAPALSWLPDPVEWYVRPSPGHTNFTLFPWAGFVFAGAVAGVAIEAGRSRCGAARTQLRLAGVALLLGLMSYFASFLPSIYERSEFWTSSPTFFFLRVAILLALLPLSFAVEKVPWPASLPRLSMLATLGRASLFVYWVHVELVYGFLSRPLRGSLSLAQVLGAYVVLTIFMLVLVTLKNRWAGMYPTDNKAVI